MGIDSEENNSEKGRSPGVLRYLIEKEKQKWEEGECNNAPNIYIELSKCCAYLIKHKKQRVGKQWLKNLHLNTAYYWLEKTH